MPVYSLNMGDALVLNALAGNSIYTGPPPVGNALQTCSAMILVNPGTGIGGMYHYPAGALTLHERGIVDAMFTAVAPTEAHLFYGNVPGIGDTGAAELVDHMLTHIGHVQRRPATSGAVAVTLAGGVVQLSTAHVAVPTVDVGPLAAGAHPFGTVWH